MQDPLVPRFSIDGGLLTVTGDVHAVVESDLCREIDKLIGSGESSLVMDISDVQYRGSSYVRLIAMAMLRAQDKGIVLTVRATKRTARVLEMGGIDKLGKIEVVPDA